MSYKDGVFAPLEQVEGVEPDAVYTVFSDEERRDVREPVGWLKAAEKSFVSPRKASRMVRSPLSRAIASMASFRSHRS